MFLQAHCKFVVLSFLIFSIIVPQIGALPVFFEHTIDDNFNGAWSVVAIDLDSDGDMDIVGAAEEDNLIAWWENDGDQNFTRYVIDDEFTSARDVQAADLDGDGDIDVLGAAYGLNRITWWENDGNQNFTWHTVVSNFMVLLQ